MKQDTNTFPLIVGITVSVFETTKKEDVKLCKVCPNKQTIQYKNLKSRVRKSHRFSRFAGFFP